jgi:hypothetical protein
MAPHTAQMLRIGNAPSGVRYELAIAAHVFQSGRAPGQSGRTIAFEAALVAAIARKPERHEFREAPRKIVRSMAQTGG